MPVCIAIRSFAIKSGAGQPVPILQTKNCVARKASGVPPRAFPKRTLHGNASQISTNIGSRPCGTAMNASIAFPARCPSDRLSLRPRADTVPPLYFASTSPTGRDCLPDECSQIVRLATLNIVLHAEFPDCAGSRLGLVSVRYAASGNQKRIRRPPR